MEIRDEGERIVRKALLEGAGCGIDEHQPYKDLMSDQEHEKCPINDAYNVIDALIKAGWKPDSKPRQEFCGWASHYYQPPPQAVNWVGFDTSEYPMCPECVLAFCQKFIGRSIHIRSMDNPRLGYNKLG